MRISDWSSDVCSSDLSRGVADELFAMPVHYMMPIEVDRAMFGGELPSAWLQEQLCGSPCERGSEPRWYDLVLAVVYTSHFVVGLTIAVVLWLRNRVEWKRWMRRYVAAKDRKSTRLKPSH